MGGRRRRPRYRCRLFVSDVGKLFQIAHHDETFARRQGKSSGQEVKLGSLVDDDVVQQSTPTHAVA